MKNLMRIRLQQTVAVLITCSIGILDVAPLAYSNPTAINPTTGQRVPVVSVQNEAPDDIRKETPGGELFAVRSPISVANEKQEILEEEVRDKSFKFGLATDEVILGDWNGDGRQKIGVRRGNAYILDVNGSGVWDHGDKVFYFGLATDEIMLGDWNGDGRTKIGVRRGNAYMLDLNGSGVWDRGDKVFRFGLDTDETLLGDWNGDGRTKVGVRRGNAYMLDLNGSGVWDHGDKVFRFGLDTDETLLGDWNGDGRTKVGVRRGNAYMLDLNGSGVWDRGDKVFRFGLDTDETLLGDWNGDGRTKVGVRRGNAYMLDLDGSGVWDRGDKHSQFGLDTDETILADWTGNGATQLGVKRENTYYLDLKGDWIWDVEVDVNPTETWTHGAYKIGLYKTTTSSDYVLKVKNTYDGRTSTHHIKNLFVSSLTHSISIYEDFGFIRFSFYDEIYNLHVGVIDLYSGEVWMEDDTTRIGFNISHDRPGYVFIQKVGEGLTIIHNPGGTGERPAEKDKLDSKYSGVTYHKDYIILRSGNYLDGYGNDLKIWSVQARRLTGEAQIPSQVKEDYIGFQIDDAEMRIGYCAASHGGRCYSRARVDVEITTYLPAGWVRTKTNPQFALRVYNDDTPPYYFGEAYELQNLLTGEVSLSPTFGSRVWGLVKEGRARAHSISYDIAALVEPDVTSDGKYAITAVRTVYTRGGVDQALYITDLKSPLDENGKYRRILVRLPSVSGTGSTLDPDLYVTKVVLSDDDHLAYITLQNGDVLVFDIEHGVPV